MTARQALLDGLARDAGIFELVSELAPLHPRDDTFPGEVFLHLAADALDWCGASRSGPLALEGLREQFLPECTFRGRQNKKFQYAVLAAAALHGGTEPDLLDEVAWWQADDFWQYGLFAAVGYIRAAASRAGVPVRQACQDLAGRPGRRGHSQAARDSRRVRYGQLAGRQRTRLCVPSWPAMAPGGLGAGPGLGMPGAPERPPGWRRRGCSRPPRTGHTARIVGLPPCDLIEQVRFGPAMDSRHGQHRVLELAILPAAEGALGQEPLA